MIGTIDRIESGFAVIETNDNKMINVPICLLPKSVKEGDIIKQMNDNFKLDIEKTTRRKEYIKDLVEDLFI